MDIIGTEGNQVLGRYNISGAFETLQSVRERLMNPVSPLVPGTSFLLQSRWPCGRALDLSL